MVCKYYENVIFFDFVIIIILIYELVNNKIMKMFRNEIILISYNYEFYLFEN